MGNESGIPPEDNTTLDLLVQVAREAVLAAQEESRLLGVPNVYGIDGKLYYELPSGELSLTDPYQPPAKSE